MRCIVKLGLRQHVAEGLSLGKRQWSMLFATLQVVKNLMKLPQEQHLRTDQFREVVSRTGPPFEALSMGFIRDELRDIAPVSLLASSSSLT